MTVAGKWGDELTGCTMTIPPGGVRRSCFLLQFSAPATLTVKHGGRGERRADEISNRRGLRSSDVHATVLCVLFRLDKVLEKCQERRIFALFHKFQQSSSPSAAANPSLSAAFNIRPHINNTNCRNQPFFFYFFFLLDA